MKWDCSCWNHYPNKNKHRKSGRWPCVEDYLCIRDLVEGKQWDCCTHCVRKENFERYKTMPDYKALARQMENGGIVKAVSGDYVVYRRDWLYEHIEQESVLIQSAKQLNVKPFDIQKFKEFMSEKGENDGGSSSM